MSCRSLQGIGGMWRYCHDVGMTVQAGETTRWHCKHYKLGVTLARCGKWFLEPTEVWPADMVGLILETQSIKQDSSDSQTLNRRLVKLNKLDSQTIGFRTSGT